MDCDKIGKLIRHLRREKSMTQRQLAQQLGVSDRAVSKWERGGWMPRCFSADRVGNGIVCRSGIPAGWRFDRSGGKIDNEACGLLCMPQMRQSSFCHWGRSSYLLWQESGTFDAGQGWGTGKTASGGAGGGLVPHQQTSDVKDALHFFCSLCYGGQLGSAEIVSRVGPAGPYPPERAWYAAVVL